MEIISTIILMIQSIINNTQMKLESLKNNIVK